MIKVKNYGKTRKDFEICLRKIKNKTDSEIKDFILKQHFEKPSVDKERIRRRKKKEKRKLKALKKKYGYKYVNYLGY